ncbi:hypothetical protein [Pajaroellobacter abortibovis]|uniref:hypothetical protein n=1 Tax=Pajaroellobacter abortibovis TaxID=1882918 RepID=UPI0012EBBBF9|nr:hypothetical protein [Pajaroellobacter abortibovis]
MIRKQRHEWYGLAQDEPPHNLPTWLACPGHYDVHGNTSFEIYGAGSFCSCVTLRVPGIHNIRNAVAAIAACCEGFGVSIEQSRHTLAQFKGVRQQELLGDTLGYNDCAHHPTAVQVTRISELDIHSRDYGLSLN